MKLAYWSKSDQGIENLRSNEDKRFSEVKFMCEEGIVLKWVPTVKRLNEGAGVEQAGCNRNERMRCVITNGTKRLAVVRERKSEPLHRNILKLFRTH